MSLRPLGIAKEIVEQLGLEVTHVYDDLVFVEHSAFLLQFDDAEPGRLKVYYNAECPPDAVAGLEIKLERAAREREFGIVHSGRFSFRPKEGEEAFEILFSA